MSNNLSRSIALKTLSQNETKRGSLHNTTRQVLFFNRVMGLLPLSGLTSQTSDKLRYTLWSPYTIYFAFSWFGIVLMLLTSLNHLTVNSTSLHIIGKVFFYILNSISSLALANTSRSWPLLMKSIEATEYQLPDFRKHFYKTISFVSMFIITAGVWEYILFVSYGLNVVHFCYSDNITENYFKLNIPWIFEYTEFTMWKGVIIQIYYIQASFIWLYSDLLLIILSLYLTEYFIVHNEHLKRAVQQEYFMFDKFRTQYLKIVHLVRMVNEQFGVIVVMSVAGNLFWTCVLLYYTLHGHLKHYLFCEVRNPEYIKSPFAVDHVTYFIYTLFYLIIRGWMVLVLASRVHSNALVPTYILYDIPSSKFTVEVQRYISQIKNINIALSGWEFFHITRTMILTLLGTIVTYELVLFQLDN